MNQLILALILIVGSFSVAVAQPSEQWGIKPTPKELPRPMLYTYLKAEEVPANSPCKWEKRSNYGWYVWPLEALDAQGHATKLTKEVVERCYPNNRVSWEDVLKHALQHFTQTSRTFQRQATDADHHSRIMVAYGLLQGASDFFYGSSPFSDRFRTGVLRTIYRSPVLQEKLYVWAMPSVKLAFRDLASNDQNEYRRALEHAKAYLDHWTPAAQDREVKYLADLAAGRCGNQTWRRKHGLPDLPLWLTAQRLPCTYLFTTYDPLGRNSPYRKVEAFIFRRIRQDGIQVATLKKWATQALRDLRA